MRKFVGLLAIVTLLLTPSIVLAASVDPTVVTGATNIGKTCRVLFPGTTEVKFDNSPQSGTLPAGDGGSITIVRPSTQLPINPNSIDFTSDGVNILGVIVKDGVDGANVYDYRPDGVTEDTYLTTPFNGAKGISHVSFCIEGEDAGADEGSVNVFKTAEATFDRTHDWSIEKTADPTSVTLYHPLSGNGNSSEDVDYTVVVTYEGFEDSNFAVSGTITIENDGDLAASITSIDDYLTSADDVTVTWRWRGPR